MQAARQPEFAASQNATAAAIRSAAVIPTGDFRAATAAPVIVSSGFSEPQLRAFSARRRPSGHVLTVAMHDAAAAVAKCLQERGFTFSSHNRDGGRSVPSPCRTTLQVLFAPDDRLLAAQNET